ncbi:MAG: TonB-dependent receptor plug domain-containing protein, partial [Steroidobacteraceae bacterium]
MHKSPVALAVSTAIAMSASGLPSAFAQELEEVVVTGSRIATEDGFGQGAPVSVINAEDIQLTGMTRLEDVLNSLPSIETSQNSFISNGATGTASVDLRGLGANRTLVLFNG